MRLVRAAASYSLLRVIWSVVHCKASLTYSFNVDPHRFTANLPSRMNI